MADSAKIGITFFYPSSPFKTASTAKALCEAACAAVGAVIEKIREIAGAADLPSISTNCRRLTKGTSGSETSFARKFCSLSVLSACQTMPSSTGGEIFLQSAGYFFKKDYSGFKMDYKKITKMALEIVPFTIIIDSIIRGGLFHT